VEQHRHDLDVDKHGLSRQMGRVEAGEEYGW